MTYSFTNGTTSDAIQVNTNFTDIINAFTDGSSDLTIGSIAVAGAATFSGNVTLGNASSDDITISGSLASNLAIKTNATYGIGSSTSGLSGVYLGSGVNKTTRIVAGTVGTSWTFTLPNDAPSLTGQTLIFDTNGTASFRYFDKWTASKTGTYNATGDETIIPVDASGGSVTINLPAAASYTGKTLTIIKTDSTVTNAVVIDANASETIYPSVQSSNLTYNLYTQYESVSLSSDGTSWYVVKHFCDTDWIDAGTMTVGATTTAPTKSSSPTVDKIRWKRIGRDAIINYSFVASGTSGAAAGTGDYKFLLPNSWSIDTTLITAFTTVVGNAAAFRPSNVCGHGVISGGTDSGVCTASVYDANYVRLFKVTSTVSGAVCATSNENYTAANVTHNFEIRVPISGWNA